ncbi:MAG: winged helix-turn-helix domain-containing protein [Promethearchaeota archaeon]
MNEKSENQLLGIDDKLKQIDNKINFLHDSILKIQNEFVMMRKREIKEITFSKLFLSAKKNNLHFLNKRTSQCEIADGCTVTFEKGIYEILCTFNEKGADKAIQLIDSHFKNIFKKDKRLGRCNNGPCAKNYIDTFKTLRNLINDSREISLRHSEELISLNKDSVFEDGIEDEISIILTPLSNPIRLKILNYLRKGGKTYSQLEIYIGIKAGHLRFHLEKLLSGGYITKERKEYIITINGLKVLKLLFELRGELVLTLKKTS